MSNSRRFRAELGRLFIQHKADLALNNWTDAEIVANVNTITGTLITSGSVALQCNKSPMVVEASLVQRVDRGPAQ